METAALPERGLVYTFYSFKGGVGRSMALANVAAVLSKWGKKVLVIDWDLEAPGIEKYFGKWLEGSRRRTPGLVELVAGMASEQPVPWRHCLLQARIPRGEPISILHAGQDDADYNARLRAIDWERMFSAHDFGNRLEALRDEWIASFDFVLVDSRTGITDIGGICTIHLPDVLISLFTANDQSLDGVRDTMSRARKKHAELPLDRKRLIVVPIPARDESDSEFQLAAEWRGKFAKELSEFYADWIPRDETSLRVLDLLKIPYLAYWSFGERLPVVEEDLDNPKNLAYSYQLIARLILSRLDMRELAGGKQAAEALAAQEAAERERLRAAAEARERVAQQTLEREWLEAQEREEQASREARAFIGDVWLPSVRRQEWIALGAACAGFLLCVIALAGPSTLLVDARAVASVGSATSAVSFRPIVSPFYALSAAVAHSTVLEAMAAPQVASILNLWTWIGAGAYLCVGVAGIYWGMLRTRRCRSALQQLGLFQTRAMAYEGMGARAALRTLLQRTRHLLGSEFGEEADPRAASTALLEGKALPAPPPEVDVARNVDSVVVEAPSQRIAAPTPDLDAPLDVLIDSRRSPITQAWLVQFVPMFESWLQEELGREVRVGWNDSASGEAQSSEQLERSLRNATIFMPIITTTYLNSVQFSASWSKAAELMPVLPIWLQGSDTTIPSELQIYGYADLREFLLIGDAFARSDLHVEFQNRVQRLARDAADAIRRAATPQPA